MKVHTFKAFGFEFPVTPGAVYALGVVAVLGTAGFIYQKLYNDPERALLSLKEVNARMAFEIEEYGMHSMEEPTKHELFSDPDGAMSIRVYADHCVMIQRKIRKDIRTRLIPDLARDAKAQYQIDSPAVPAGALGLPVLYAAEAPACNRGCLNPHPGQFRWWYGQQRGSGWVEVWRQWPDGCLHVQMLHAQSQSWDTNADGTPRIHWTCCTH